jgi:zinc-ribbon domain
MSFCGNCGTRLAPGVRFCGECGTPVAGSETPGPAAQQTPQDAAADVEPLPATAPDEPPGATASLPPVQQTARDGLLARLSPEALLAGDWRSAGRVALTAMSVMLAISFVGEMLGQTYKLGTEAVVVATLTMTAGALGGDAVYSSDGPVQHIGFTPLTVTLAGAAVLAILISRWLDRHPSTLLVDCVVQTARVVVVFCGLSLIISLVGRGKIPFEEGASERYSVHATVAGTFFGALLLSVCSAVLAFALRPDILPTNVRRIRDRAAGPVHSLAISALLALALTALAGVVLILTALDTGKPAAFASLLVALPNAMIYAVLTGMGVSSQVTASGTASLDPLGHFLDHIVGTTGKSVDLLDVTQKSAWFWLLTVGAVAFWAIAALLSVLRERAQPAARRNALWLVGSSVVFALVGVWLTTTTTATQGVAVNGSWGPSAGGTFLLTLLWAAVAAFLAVGLAPQLRPSLGPLARRVGALSLARGRETDPTSRDR